MEPELQELIKKIEGLISKEGLKVSGNGIIITLLEKLIAKLDKVDSKLYWMEKRDKERTEKAIDKERDMA